MIGLPESFLKEYNEKHSPHTLFGVISSSIQSGTDWATALLNWAKRKEITINGAAKTPTFEDDFTSSGTTSHTSSPSTVGGWLAQDHTKILVNGSTDEITWQASRSSNDNCSYDIGTALSDSAWVMDVDLEIDTLTAGGGGENGLLVYMSSVSSATASESNG